MVRLATRCIACARARPRAQAIQRVGGPMAVLLYPEVSVHVLTWSKLNQRDNKSGEKRAF